MSLCEVCWAAEAEHECGMCRRRVCREHFKADAGICSICFENLCEVCGQRLAVDSCVVCGKLVCRRCSEDLQPGIRVCRECLSDIHDRVKRDASLRYLERMIEGSRGPPGRRQKYFK